MAVKFCVRIYQEHDIRQYNQSDIDVCQSCGTETKSTPVLTLILSSRRFKHLIGKAPDGKSLCLSHNSDSAQVVAKLKMGGGGGGGVIGTAVYFMNFRHRKAK